MSIARIEQKDLLGLNENGSRCEVCGEHMHIHRWADMDANGFVVRCSIKGDQNGNINAVEGVDRCQCGCKYWENDKCVSCGTLIEIVKIRQIANESRFLLDMNMNVLVTTTVYYNYGWHDFVPLVGDVVDITTRHREAGHIR